MRATVKAPKTILDKDDFKTLNSATKIPGPSGAHEDREFIVEMATSSSWNRWKPNTGFEKLADNINNNLIPALMFQQSNLVGREVAYLDPDSLRKKPGNTNRMVDSVLFKTVLFIILLTASKLTAYIFQVGGLPNQVMTS